MSKSEDATIMFKEKNLKQIGKIPLNLET